MIINNKIWMLLESELQGNAENKCINSTDEEIICAEEELGIKFSDFYRYFLKTHQVSSIFGTKINTLNKSKENSDSDCSVVEATKKFIEEGKYPNCDGWYIVAENEDGDLIAESDKREIWVLYRDESDKRDKVANNFEDFVYSLVKDRVEEA